MSDEDSLGSKTEMGVWEVESDIDNSWLVRGDIGGDGEIMGPEECATKLNALESRLQEQEQEIERIQARGNYGDPCQRCGAPHMLDTSVPSEIWNVIVERESEGGDKWGLLCTKCIDELCALHGFKDVAVGFYFVGEAIHGDTRGFEVKEAWRRFEEGQVLLAEQERVIEGLRAKAELVDEMRRALILLGEGTVLERNLVFRPVDEDAFWTNWVARYDALTSLNPGTAKSAEKVKE